VILLSGGHCSQIQNFLRTKDDVTFRPYDFPTKVRDTL
jgi:hypothetical protein